MPRTDHKLSWFEKTKQWRKFRTCRVTGKGRMYYLAPAGVRRSDLKAKAEAWGNWQALLAKIEAEEERARQRNEPPQRITATRLSSLLALATDYRHPRFATASTVQRETVESRNVAELVARYLARKQRETDAGERSVQDYREHADKLGDFVDFCRDRLGTLDIGEIVDAAKGRLSGLEAYRDAQMSVLNAPKAEGGRSPATVKKRLTCVRQFIEWCYEAEVIDALPRIVNRKFAKVRLPEARPKFFTPEEIEKLLAGATDRMRLLILLGLNCGYNPTCISSLRHDHIDWSAAVIDRPRHKTRGKQRHKLWPETLRLLRQEATKPDRGLEGSGPVLLTSHGTPLVQERITGPGKTIRTDTVGRQFTRLKEALGMTGDNRGFKVLRSTSAELIKESHGAFVASIFLAHVEKETRRHYVTPDYRALFEALETLAPVYRLEP